MFEENFTLIHCHSCHSVKDSPLQIRDMVARAKALGVQNLTLTDHGTGTGLIEFMDACQAQGQSEQFVLQWQDIFPEIYHLFVALYGQDG